MGHYYDRDGKPQHYQVTKTGVNKGKKRDTRLSDAKKLGLVPSVTGIIGVLDKGGLTSWLIREAVKEATDKNYKRRDFAAEGTVIHDYIEQWINGITVEDKGLPYIESMKACFSEYGVENPIAEATFATEHYGGAVDCHDKEAGIIIDYKTKDFDEEKDASKFIYDNHSMQLYAYREGLGLPEDTRLVNVFLSRTTPHLWCAYEHTPEEIKRGGEMFELCSKLWRLIKNV